MNKGVPDLVIRIKNAYMANKKNVSLAYSKMNEDILKILKRNNYIKDYEVVKEDKKQFLSAVLKYNKGMPAVTDVKICSKQGRREYVRFKDIKPVIGGLGIAVLSTSKGILTDKDAKKEKIGGELLFQIW